MKKYGGALLCMAAFLCFVAFLLIAGAGFAPEGVSAYPDRGSAQTGDARIDLNRATAEELEMLPGIGPALSAAIVESRETDGPFRSAEDLLRVKGIGEKKLEAVRDMIRVD